MNIMEANERPTMTTTNITIIHGFELMNYDGKLIERMPFMPSETEFSPADGYRVAYSYEAELEFVLDSFDAIYHDNNTIDGPSINQENESRSLSVGDIIVVEAEGIRPHTVAVMSFGFAVVDASIVLARMSK